MNSLDVKTNSVICASISGPMYNNTIQGVCNSECLIQKAGYKEMFSLRAAYFFLMSLFGLQIQWCNLIVYCCHAEDLIYNKQNKLWNGEIRVWIESDEY